MYILRDTSGQEGNPNRGLLQTYSEPFHIGDESVCLKICQPRINKAEILQTNNFFPGTYRCVHG